MFTWALVNVCLSLLALLYVTLNASAPHRMRFVAAFAALVCWLVPWQLLPSVPAAFLDIGLAQVERELVGGNRFAGATVLFIDARALPLTDGFLLFTMAELVLGAMGAVGLVLFGWNLAAHHFRLWQLLQTGRDGNELWHTAASEGGLAPGMAFSVPITIQSGIAGAFSSGLWYPRIWVHRDLVASPQLATLLRHELTHIRQHDNWYLLLITLVEKLFWWNPLVWLLGRRTRALQELSCDEACSGSITDYPARLAQLMLESARPGKRQEVLALSANIFNNPNPNIERIKLLQRSYVMKPRHLASAVATAVIALLTVGLVTAQPDEPVPVAGQRVIVIDRQFSTAAGATAPLVVGRAVRQTLDEEGNVLFEMVEGPDFDESGLMPAEPAVMLHRMEQGFVTSTGAMNQFLKVEGSGDDMQISFSFTDAPLPMVLAPLTRLGEGIPAPSTIIMMAVSADQLNTPVAGVRATPTLIARRISENVVLEFEDAADRLVTASGANLSLRDALDLIAAESGCNIFRDGDTIVVDWCSN